MALTFKITNGDVEINGSTGRPKMVGNDIKENILSKAKEKTSQDIREMLSISKILSGAGAGIADLIGVVHQVGFLSTKVLVQRQITSSFNNLVRLQSLRPGVRVLNERFSRITLFRILQDKDRTSFRFRLDVVTDGGGNVSQSGTIVG